MVISLFVLGQKYNIAIMYHDKSVSINMGLPMTLIISILGFTFEKEFQGCEQMIQVVKASIIISPLFKYLIKKMI